MKRIRKTEVGPEAYKIKVREGRIRDENGRVLGNRKGIYREDNGELLGIHSSNYGIVQYGDLKDAVDNAMAISMGVDLESVQFSSTLYQSSTDGTEIVSKGGVTGATGESTFTGSMGGRVSMSWRVPMFQKEDIVTGDPIGYTFEVDTSMDGVWSNTTKTKLERVACLNGWVKSTNVFATKFKHTKHIDIETIVKRINSSLEVFEEGVAEYGSMFSEFNQTAISQHEGHNIVTNMGFQKADRENILSLWKSPFLWSGYSDDRRPAASTWDTNNKPFTSVSIDGKSWLRPTGVDKNAKIGDLFNCITQHLTHTCKGKLYAARKGQAAFSRLLELVEGDREDPESLRMFCEAPKVTRTRKETNALVITTPHNTEA